MSSEIEFGPDDEATTEFKDMLTPAAIAAHPGVEDCPVDECMQCGYRDCPSHCIEHYWHDGCHVCDA